MGAHCCSGPFSAKIGPSWAQDDVDRAPDRQAKLKVGLFVRLMAAGGRGAADVPDSSGQSTLEWSGSRRAGVAPPVAAAARQWRPREHLDGVKQLATPKTLTWLVFACRFTSWNVDIFLRLLWCGLKIMQILRLNCGQHREGRPKCRRHAKDDGSASRSERPGQT